MKKKVFRAVLMFFLTMIGLVSCDKNESESLTLNQNEKKGSLIQNSHINVSLCQQFLRGDSIVWLHFESKDDYFDILDLLEFASDEDLEDFEEEMAFPSMRSLLSEEERESIGIDDDVLAALINVNGEIQIGDSLYTIIIPNNIVKIKNLIDNTQTEVSLDYEVFNEDYMQMRQDDDEEDDDELLSASYNLPSDIEPSQNVKCKVKYCRAAIFFSLKAVMKEFYNINGFYSSKNMHVFSGSYTQNKNSASMVTFPEYSVNGNNRKYKHVVYRRAKGLKQFTLTTDFTVYHYSNGSNHSYVRLGIYR